MEYAQAHITIFYITSNGGLMFIPVSDHDYSG
jgi:hypothetical protein